jgi:hypothetical protein
MFISQKQVHVLVDYQLGTAFFPMPMVKAISVPMLSSMSQFITLFAANYEFSPEKNRTKASSHHN